MIQISNTYLDLGIEAYNFCGNNGWLMENMDKGLKVQK